MRVTTGRSGVLIGLLLLAACSGGPRPGEPGDAQTTPAVRGYKVGKPYQIKGKWYYPEVNYSYVEDGIASWYGPGFHGRQTANGETYDMNDLTAAHRTLPMPCVVRVTNLENGRSLKLRVNDRGPFARERIIDVSRRASQLLGFHLQGTTPVRVEIVEDESRMMAAALGVPSDVAWVQAHQGTPAAAPAEAPAVELAAAAQPAPLTGVGTTASFAVADAAAAADATAVTETAAATEGASPDPVAAVSLASADPGVAEIGAVPDAMQAAAEPAAVVPESSPPAYVSYAAYAAPPADPVYGAAAAAAVPPVSHGRHSGASGDARWVQAGAFADPGRAAAVRRRLASIGPIVTTPSIIGGRSLLRVRVGPLYSDAQARQVLTSVTHAGFPESRIVDD